MATFVCIRSGNHVTFTRDGDIAAMRKEPGYRELVEERQPAALPDSNQSKRRGRPRNKPTAQEQSNEIPPFLQ